MRISTFISFAGFVLLIVGTFCPIIHFALFNQTVYQLNKPYGLVFLLVAVVGILGTVLNNKKLTRLIAWVLAGLVVVFYIAALIKIHFSFSFIPFHSLSNYLTGKITFRWGWYLLCTGAALALAGTFGKTQTNFNSTI